MKNKQNIYGMSAVLEMVGSGFLLLCMFLPWVTISIGGRETFGFSTDQSFSLFSGISKLVNLGGMVSGFSSLLSDDTSLLNYSSLLYLIPVLCIVNIIVQYFIRLPWLSFYAALIPTLLSIMLIFVGMDKMGGYSSGYGGVTLGFGAVLTLICGCGVILFSWTSIGWYYKEHWKYISFILLCVIGSFVVLIFDFDSSNISEVLLLLTGRIHLPCSIYIVLLILISAATEWIGKKRVDHPINEQFAVDTHIDAKVDTNIEVDSSRDCTQEHETEQKYPIERSVEGNRKKKLLLGGMIAAGVIVVGVLVVIFISGGKEAASQSSEVSEEEMEKNLIAKIALFPNYTYEFKGEIGGRYPVTMTLITNRDLQTMVNYSYDKDGIEHTGSPYIQFDGHTLSFNNSDPFGNTTIVEGNATDSVTITGTWCGDSIDKELSFTLKMVHSEAYDPKAIVTSSPPAVASSVEEVLEITETEPESTSEPTSEIAPVEVEPVLEHAEESDKNAVLEAAETMPEFPGGQTALNSYLAGNVKYPKEAVDNGTAGRVVAAFIVGHDGSINDARVIRSVSPELDKEALRVVNSMPHWKPGTQKGESVRVKHTMSIMFRLQ